MTRRDLWTMWLAIVGALVPILACAAQQRETEHPRNVGQRIEIDAPTYWFYEAMGMLQGVQTVNGRVEGTFTERQRATRFAVPADQVRDPAARTAGYKQAVARIIGYMRPGAVPDTESNRQYLRELQTKLKAMTGLDFATYDEWKQWFDANREKLKWSDEKKVFVVEG